MKDFNSKEKSKFIQYLDANNLYGWAMSQPLPVSGFKWMKEKDLDNWEEIPCILEVDLEYPKELYDLHNDYPLAPERITVNKVKKRIPNLEDKKKYILHCKNLKQYLDIGLKLTKIHRGISFNEKAWMKPYLDLNTKLRTESTNDFEKDFFNLMNNSVFGKTVENIRSRVDIRLRTSEKTAEKLVSMPGYERITIFSEDLVAVHMHKTKINFNKPIYLGMCILDSSKILMYDFHYNCIKKKYQSKAKLLMTDTDSLMYEIHTEDFFKDIHEDISDKFDTSNFEKDHSSGIKRMHKKVFRMMKD